MKLGTKLCLKGKFPGVPKGAEFMINAVEEPTEHCKAHPAQPATITGVTCHEHSHDGEMVKVGFSISGQTMADVEESVKEDFIIIDRAVCSFANRYKVKKAPKCGCRQCQYLWNTKRGVDLTPAF